MTSLIIGGGFVGSVIEDRLRSNGAIVTIAGRADCSPTSVGVSARLEGLLESAEQVVLTAQLASLGIESIVDRIDGPRWLVFSSAQVTTSIVTPEIERARALEADALRRGATVVRPTMIFGHGRDRNISALVRTILRSPIVPVMGGSALVAPIHVDDVAEFAVDHHPLISPGLYGLAGPESLPFREVVQDLAAITGRRIVPVEIPPKLLHISAGFARTIPFLPLRSDQLLRSMEDRASTGATPATSAGWRPHALAHRLEQAVDEVRGLPDRAAPRVEAPNNDA